MKKFLVAAMICAGVIANTAALAEVNYKARYRDQVEVNIRIDNQYRDYKDKMSAELNKCDRETDKLKVENKYLKNKKEQWIVKIPFTKIGITVGQGQGFVVGVVLGVILF